MSVNQSREPQLRHSLGRTSRIVLGLCLVALGLSIGANIALYSRLPADRWDIEPPEPIAKGTLLKPIDGKVSGQPARVSYDGTQRTILYFFSAACGWCERNWSNVNALRGRATGYRFVAVSVAPDPDGIGRQRLGDAEILTDIPDDSRLAYNVLSTPRTMVIDSGGRLLADWIGAFDDQRRAEVERFFGFALPGLDAVEVK